MARRKNTLKKDILKLLILTTIVIFIWIGFEVYFKLTRPVPPEVSEKILKPLNPEFEEEVLEEIKNRRFITDEELKDISSKQMVLKEESEEATESGERETEVATESGELEGE